MSGVYARVWISLKEGDETVGTKWEDVFFRPSPPRYRVVTVCIGQTGDTLEKRYSKEKTATPMKEWFVEIDSPALYENELRKKLKRFFASKDYFISSVMATRMIITGESDKRIFIYWDARQVSKDRFEIMYPDDIQIDGVIVPDRELVSILQRFLIFSFLDGYFGALQSSAKLLTTQQVLF